LTTAVATAAPATTRKPPLTALTGLRTLLALSIVFFHFTPPHMEIFSPVFNNGFVFVGFFFLISGFILAYNYAERPTPLVKRDFWVARFSRLYPVYLVALALSFQMLQSEWSARSHSEFFQGLLLTPLLLQGWSPNLATFWNTVAWTLSCEFMLYLAFPWLIRIPLPERPSRLIALLLTLWIVGLVPHTLYILLNPDHLAAGADRYTSTFWIRALKYTPPAYICTFLCGVTLGRLQSRLTLGARQRFLLAACSLLVLGLTFYLALPHVPYILLHGGLLLPLFAALTIGLSGPHLLSSAFSFRPLVFIGQSTFCLYLLHFNVFLLIRSTRLMERLHLAALDPWITYASIIALALAVHKFVETPARKALTRRFSRQHAAPKPAAEFSSLSYNSYSRR
jgi:peptidoglycan/LPS O-acetylase OafA/YrhL